MARLQRNQNLAVSIAVGDAIAEGQVDAGIGQPYVVENRIEFLGRNHPADLPFDGRKDSGRLLYSSSSGTAHVQPHLSGIDIGKEILADNRN